MARRNGKRSSIRGSAAQPSPGSTSAIRVTSGAYHRRVKADSEYHGLLASTYDLLRGATTGWSDRSFYRQAIERFGVPALDVGCATGRLLLDFMADGVDVDGVDSSPDMLALCREKAARLGLSANLFEQRMESLDLPRRYRTILVPSSSFQLVCDLGAAAEAMRRFWAHLAPSGALVMPFMIPVETEPIEWRITGEQTRPQDGATVRRWSRSRHDVTAQLEHSWDRFEVVVEGEVVASEECARSPMRWYSQTQAAGMYDSAGFVAVEVLEGFSTEPAKPGAPLFSVVGIRPADG